MTEEGKVIMSARHSIEGKSQSRQLVPERFRVSRIGSVRTRLLVAFVLLVLLPAVAVSAVSAVTGFEIGRQQAIEQLESVAGLKEAEVNDWVDSLQPGLTAALTERDTLLFAQGILRLDVPGPDLAAGLKGRFAQSIERTQLFESLSLLDLEGETVVTTDDTQENVVHSDQAYFQEGLKGPYVNPPFYSQPLGRVVLVAVQPVLDREGQTLGVLAGYANLAVLNDIMLGRVGLGETGEAYLVDQNRALLTPLRSGEAGIGANTQGAGVAIESQRNGSGLYRNYAGEPVIGVYHWLPELQVTLLAEQYQSEAFGAIYVALGVNVGVALLFVLLAVGVSLLVARGIAAPLSNLTETVTRIAAGDLDRIAKVEREDEVGAMAQAFNSMTTQLRDLIGNLEQRVADRTRDLQAAAEVARATTSVLDMDELLPGLVELVRERFGLYYVGLFLVEEEGDSAVLRAGTGEAGRQMLAQGHRLEVGGDSMIGQCLATSQARVALDVGEEAVRFDNPLLPETRSEMALPLRSRERSIGAMTVQSVEGTAFDEADVSVMQTLADQVAVAIDNARLFTNAQIALQEMEAVQSRYLGQAWAEYATSKVASGYEQTDAGMVSFGGEVLPEVRRAMTEQRSVVWNDDGSVELSALVVPIVVRGQPIGALGIRGDGGSRQWAEGDIDLIEAVAERIALAAENLRLLDETQRYAAREQASSHIVDRMRRAVDMETLMQTTIQEMAAALGASSAFVQLSTPSMGDEDEDVG